MRAGLLAVAVALTVARAAAARPAAICSIPDDSQQRQWTLEQFVDDASEPSWRVVFKSRALDKPQTQLRLPRAQPLITPGAVALLFTTANGGRRVDWRAKDGESMLDIYVNFGLEVNVEADLDPAVEHMNTEGPISVTCRLGRSDGTESNQELDLDSEWVIGTGAAWGIELFQSTGNRWYGVQTVSWGRELTGDLAPGFLRGRFAWAIEAMPVFAQTRPTHVYGAGVAPVLWRWNFVPRPRWSAFGELAMGGLWTSSPVPEKTRRVNFTAHWGAG